MATVECPNGKDIMPDISRLYKYRINTDRNYAKPAITFLRSPLPSLSPACLVLCM